MLQWVCVVAYRHAASPMAVLSLASLAFFAQETGLSCLTWKTGGLSSPFLFLNSLVPFFGPLLLLAASSLMSSPTADGLPFRFSSLPLFPPPAVRLCCLMLRGDWTLSWMTEHAEVWCTDTFKISHSNHNKNELRPFRSTEIPPQKRCYYRQNILSVIALNMMVYCRYTGRT